MKVSLFRASVTTCHAASLDAAGFATMVAGVHEAFDALGDGHKQPTGDEADTRLVARRSLVLVRDVTVGEVIAERDLDAMRPATGISPLRLDEVVGRRAARALAARQPLMPDDLDPALRG